MAAKKGKGLPVGNLRKRKPPKNAPSKKAAPPEESSSEEETAPGDEKKPRILAPKRIFRGDEAKDQITFVQWRRHIKLWKSRYTNVSDAELGSYLLDAVAGKAERTVQARVQEGEETYTNVMEALEKRYGDRKLVSIATYLKKLTNMHRTKGKSLAEFLEDFEETRQETIAHGWTPSPETDGIGLLAACALTTEQHAGILSRLQAMGVNQSPTYEAVSQELELLASSMQMIENIMAKETPTLFAPQKGDGKGKKGWKGDGKGKSKGKAKGKGQGKSKGWQGWQGKSKGWQGKGQWKGDGKGKSVGVCWDYLQGKCWRNQCRFQHTKTEQSETKAEQGKTKGGGKGAALTDH